MRDTTYDNAKGIGLILVILGHLLPFGEAVIQTVSILNKSDYLKFYFRINI